MPDADPSTLKVLKALANANRLQIVQWLASPEDHFAPQVDGDLVRDGVCLGRLVDKLQLAQPTVTSHMRTLVESGLVTSKPIKNWVFYKLDEAALQATWLSFAAETKIR